MKRLLAFLLACLPLAALAQRQYIDVGSPDFRPLALAVAPFQASPDARGEASEVFETLRDDLALTPVFELLDPRSFLADPNEGFAASGIRFQRWADVGAEGLVKATIRHEGPLLSGELHVYEVRAGREVLYRI